MNFIDKIRVDVAAGSGGNGCLSFRREKYVELGGPDGGDGGKGGDVIFESTTGLTTLLDLARRPHLTGHDGEPGKGSKKEGLSAEDLVVSVPVGTVVYRVDSDYPTGRVLMADLSKAGMRFLAAPGGRGGRGNASFKTQRYTAPRLFEHGEPGRKAVYELELKLIADVGLVGFPNAGKSTLLSRLTAARPKVADYPFTTLSPHLGVAAHKGHSFVIADIPGLIEGAHTGKGLGMDFLRHVERTRVLVHMIDPLGFTGSRGEAFDAERGYKTIEAELASYSKKLATKPRIIAVNKMDLPEASAVLKRFKRRWRSRAILGVSAATGKGLDALLDAILLALSRYPAAQEFEPTPEEVELVKVKPGYHVEAVGGGRYKLSGPFVERAVAMLEPSLPEAIQRFQQALKHIGVERALRKAGIQAGDTVTCGTFEFEWFDEPTRKLHRRRKAHPRTRIGVGKKR